MKQFKDIASDPASLSKYMTLLAEATRGIVPPDADFVIVLVGEVSAGIEPQYVSSVPRSQVSRSIEAMRAVADRLESKKPERSN